MKMPKLNVSISTCSYISNSKFPYNVHILLEGKHELDTFSSQIEIYKRFKNKEEARQWQDKASNLLDGLSIDKLLELLEKSSS